MKLSKKAQTFKDQLNETNSIAEESRSTIEEERSAAQAVLQGWMSDAPEVPEDVNVTEKTVLVMGQSVRLRLYHLVNMRDGELHPAILYHPGGGLVYDMQHMQDYPCALLCKASRSIVVSIQPPLAPEFKLPQILSMVSEFTKSLFAEAKEYGINPNAITISGYSMGGNLALSTALGAVEHGLPLKALALISGQVDLSLNARQDERYNAGAELDFLAPIAMQEKFINFIVPEDADLRQPEYSPLFSNLDKLPRVELIGGDCDALMSDMRAMEAKCREQNTPVNLTTVPGAIHNAFFMWHLLGNDARHMALLIGEKL